MFTRTMTCLLFVLASSFTSAADADAAGAPASGLTKKGADTCLKCHDEDPILSIFKTKHGQPADPQSPFRQLQCEACHGPGGEHAKKTKSTEPKAPIIDFNQKSIFPIEQQNGQCLQCHDSHARATWQGSAHEINDLLCSTCHVVHAEHDPALSEGTQETVCYQCHRRQRAAAHKPNAHPIRSAKMKCSSCHESHGSLTDTLLVKATVNETCYGCHAEKRGPFLWQHAPVDEQCTLCHDAHGSNHKGMLVQRSTQLCKRCHSQAGHPSLAPSGTGLPGGAHEAFGNFLLGKSCLNCHSQIHGSNHPSGVKLQR